MPQKHTHVSQKNPISDASAIEAIQLISANILNVVKNPDDLDGRLALANGSALAGIAFSNSMVGMVHTLGHSIGAVCRTARTVCACRYFSRTVWNTISIKAGILPPSYCSPLPVRDEYARTPKKERAAKTISIIRKMNDDLSGSNRRSPT